MPTNPPKKSEAAPKSRARWIAIDFDGVLAQYDGYCGKDVFGPPMKGAREATARLRKMGWRILVYTTRRATPALLRWLGRHRITYDLINSTRMNPPGTSIKPRVDVMLDDRAVCFTGSWPDAMRAIPGFEPWYKRRRRA